MDIRILNIYPLLFALCAISPTVFSSNSVCLLGKGKRMRMICFSPHEAIIEIEEKPFTSSLNIHPEACCRYKRRVAKRCRLSWLTNSVLVYEPKCQGLGGGGAAGKHPMIKAECAHGVQINFGDLTGKVMLFPKRHHTISQLIRGCLI